MVSIPVGARAAGSGSFGVLPATHLEVPMPPVAEAPRSRKYLPTLSDLVDRLTIVQMKMIFIPERRAEYEEERDALIHDVGLLTDGTPVSGRAVWAIAGIQLANRFIWENETKIRDGSSDEPTDVQLRRLKATHAINGVRNTFKNVLADEMGGRHDYKIDAMSADLPPEFGHWDIFKPGNGA